jgi:cell division protein FtsB
MDFRVEPTKSRLRQDGLRAWAVRAPQAEAFIEESVAKLRPAIGWLRGARRRLATAGVVVLALWLFVHVVFGANGMMVYRQKRAEYYHLRKEIGALQAEGERHSQQIKALKTDPATIEKEAREQLHYTRPGEVVYVAPEAPAPNLPSTDAAHK